MKPAQNLSANFPKLAQWITANIPRVTGKPQVLLAFVKFSEEKNGAGVIALSPYTLPQISYATMIGANGEFSGGQLPNTVFLDREICERFETSPRDRADPRMHILLESTILHEMVHWGDWKDGVDQAGEEGKQFEFAAYGRDVSRYW